MNRITGKLLAFFFLAAVPHVPCPSPAAAATSPGTEVKVINGVPRILVNGQDAVGTINQIYYYPSFSGNERSLVNEYRRGTWLSGVKQQIDEMAGYRANTLELDLWWSELAEERKIDFEPLDEALTYAGEKGIFVILSPKVDTLPPLWWANENDFPDPFAGLPCIPQEAGSDHACIPREICATGDPRCCAKPREELYCCALDSPFPPGAGGPPQARLTADGLPTCRQVAGNPRYKTCSSCETDSYGWKYSSPGWGGARFQQDFGEFLKALITRYRTNPALVGWKLSFGPTSEDIYGPSYVFLRMIYGNVMGDARSDQVMDYSDDAQRKFKEWIRGRYLDDDQLQRAWGDPGLTLQTVRLPDPRRLFKGSQGGRFPDNFTLHLFVELDALTQPGRDLYDFREEVRNRSRSAFTKLCKDLDPRHILIYTGTNNDGIFSDPAIDAIQGQNHVEYALTRLEESGQIAVLTALNARHGKASTFGIESTGREGRSGLVPGGPSGLDQGGQKAALKHAAQTILCSGGYLGYASEIGEGNFLPSWSGEEKQLLKEIALFTPTKDCVCRLVPSQTRILLRHTVGDLVDRLGLQNQYRCPRTTDAADPRPREREQSLYPPPSGQPGPQPWGAGQGRPYCGDGICDDFEKSRPGVCPQDCH